MTSLSQLSNNFANFNNFKNFNLHKINLNNQTVSSFKFNNSKLKPLSNDTISFTANKGGFSTELYDSTRCEQACQTLSDEATPLEGDLRKILLELFKDSICNKENKELPIRAISFRTKSPNSIKEKAIDILGDIISKKENNDFDPKKIDHLKKRLGDIVGARIVLTDFSTKEIEKIVDKIVQAVEDDKIHVISIKNYVPFNSKDKRKYIKIDKLTPIMYASLEKGQNVTMKSGVNDAGYIGIHIGITFDKDLDESVTPIKGEIQILDEYVAKLKDLEDFCYKLRGNKPIRGGDIAYIPFTQYFYHYYCDKENYPNIKEDWLIYTQRAYEKQRKIGASTHEEATDKLPTIEECNMVGRIPEELDFNKLLAIKKAGDIAYKNSSK